MDQEKAGIVDACVAEVKSMPKDRVENVLDILKAAAFDREFCSYLAEQARASLGETDEEDTWCVRHACPASECAVRHEGEA